MTSIINDKFKEILLPTILIAMALNITSIIDSAFVSSFVGPDALAAMELLEPIVLLITVIEWLFGLGGQVLSLNRKAEFDEEGSNTYFTITIFATLIVCILILVVCYFNTDSLITLLHGPKDTLTYLNEYAPYLFICFPLSTVLGVISQYMRVDGQAKFSSAVIIIANLINLVLDFVFMYYFKMGVAGAGIASLIGYVVGLLCVSKYWLDPNRTFRMIHHAIPLKTWGSYLWNIFKTGAPSASMGLFDMVLVYVMNIILIEVLDSTGLVAYSVSVNSLLIISILVIGIADTITSIIPLYYTQKDYLSVKNIVNKGLYICIAISIASTILIWIFPQFFLMFFNLNNLSETPVIVNALRLSSLGFFIASIATVLIFYYEAIDQSTISTIMAAIAALIGPLIMLFASYPVLGDNAIWVASALGALLSVIVAVGYVKIFERRQDELSGMLFINKSLIEKTRYYTLENRDCGDRSEMLNYLNTFNLDESDKDCLNFILDKIFDMNGSGANVEVMVIDYDDNINVNIKEDGTQDVFKLIEKKVDSKENIKYARSLDFNNFDLVMDKIT